MSRIGTLVRDAGPVPGSCACWHLRNLHDGSCTFQGCGCTRFRWSWSLVDMVLPSWRWLRGWS